MKRIILILMIILCAGLASAVPDFTNNLEVYYATDNSTGNLVDSSGNGNTMTAGGGSPQNIDGFIGDGQFLYDGTTDYHEFPTLGIFDGSADYSISVWFNWTNPGSEDKLFGVRGERNCQLGANGGVSNISWQCFQNPGPGVVQVTTQAITANVEHNVIVVYNASAGMFIYLDGVLEMNNSYTGTPNIDTATNQIAAIKVGVQLWQGTMDEMAIWSRGLTSEEIANISALPGCNLVIDHTGCGKAASPDTKLFNITAIDSYTAGALTNFTALVNGTLFTTTDFC